MGVVHVRIKMQTVRVIKVTRSKETGGKDHKRMEQLVGEKGQKENYQGGKEVYNLQKQHWVSLSIV